MDPQRPNGRPVPPRSQQPAPEAAPAQRQYESTRETRAKQPVKPRRSWKKWAWIIIPVVVALIALCFTLNNLGMIGERAAVKKNQYQAVFLTNNEVYFGKITYMNHDTITLKDVYYLRKNSSDTTTTATQQTNGPQQVTLAKLGKTEVHGPEDEMHVDRRQVYIWENIRDDSQVVKNIKLQK